MTGSTDAAEAALAGLDDEAARPAALDASGILDALPEQGFDDVVLLAAQLCRTPVALMTLVGSDHQWFRARVGFPHCETPLAQSVCSHALRQPGMLVIPDLTADPRTKDNTLVTGEPFIRFYAGARLTTPDGLGIGTLCVIDTEPRPEGLTPAQAEALEALARQVMAQLELRRSAAARAEARQAFVGELGERVPALAPHEDPSFVAAELLGRTLGVSRVGFGTVDPDRETLHVSRDYTAPGVDSLAGSLRLRDYGSAIDSMKAGEVVAIADVREEPRTAPAAAALEGRSARSFANVPVLEKGRLVAVMFVNNAEPRDWTADHVALLRLCAERTRAAVERARTEAALRELNETLEAQVAARTAERDRMWETSPDLLLVIDFAGVLRRVNPAWTTILGYAPEELVGRHVNAFVLPDDHRETTDTYEAAAEGGQPRIENRYRHKDGTTQWISWTAAPAGDVTHATGRDVTEQKEQADALALAEEALRQSQKMEAVGQLTGGLAHDLNNLLAGISGSLELMGTRVAQGRLADVDRYMVAAQGAAKRAAALTQRLLVFSRRQTLSPKITNVNALVAGMEELIRRAVGPTIAVESVSGGGVWPVLVDPDQLEDALLNLCLNARDALPEGGTLSIETANRWLDTRGARERDLPPGQHVSLCVSDTGTGMAPEGAARAFDPFFATKPIGQGPGLGLSMVHGFARQSGGQARIHSKPGQGTSVCLYLPRHLEGGAEQQDGGSPAAEASPAGSGEAVPVIDDEPLVRRLVVDALAEAGYAVLEAEDGPSGLRHLRSSARIDLLVTDVGLPGGLNGRQVADAARALRPGLPVLFVTGHAEPAAPSPGPLDPGARVATKTFRHGPAREPHPGDDRGG